MEVAHLVDAGPLIGWLNAADQWHSWSVETLSKIRGPLHTTDIVLGEACWHLGGNTQPVHALPGLVRVGAIQLLQPWPGLLERTQTLMMKYERMDAADASLFPKENNPDGGHTAPTASSAAAVGTTTRGTRAAPTATTTGPTTTTTTTSGSAWPKLNPARAPRRPEADPAAVPPAP